MAEKEEKKKTKFKKDDLEELKRKLQECEKQRDEYLAGWQRQRADLLNYKKEEAQKFQQLLKYAVESLVLNFLAILDNFEITENSLTKEQKKEPSIQGLLQIKTQIQDFLKQQGLQEIEAENKKFDPNFHEVVQEIEKQGEESGKIIEVIQKGYTLNNRVIRPSKVKIIK